MFPFDLPFDLLLLTAQPVQTFDRAGLMVPPFVKYPRIARGSIGWRWGSGEAYFCEFVAWWAKQPAGVRAEVRDAYPEPLGWVKFYDELEPPAAPTPPGVSTPGYGRAPLRG